MGYKKWHSEKAAQGQERPASGAECLIKFKHGDLRELRSRLLADLSHEYYAVLMGKSEHLEECKIIAVYDTKFLSADDYQNQSMAFLRLKKEFVYKILVEVRQRYDVNTLIDVHTHPFCQESVHFSGTDDQDERTFYQFLRDKFDNIHYASIVLSQEQYSARVWDRNERDIVCRKARIKTQTMPEHIVSSDFPEYETFKPPETNDVLHRSTLALGLEVMRKITQGQVISVVGAGGLGSVVAEHLIHTGFRHINLIDPDVLEMSNLNRVVGAYYEDAKRSEYKVTAIRAHLQKIAPDATIHAYKNDVKDHEMEKVLALSDWIIVTTDNHASRLRVQQLSLRYFVPIISAGVNITVENEKIQDMSGEVITARPGDHLCLNCLGRINPIQVAQESHPDSTIRTELVKRGYVTGKTVKEPAVKTLNTMLATIAVDTLVNQYTERQRHVPILVYEDNASKAIYEDKASLEKRNKDCFTCNV